MSELLVVPGGIRIHSLGSFPDTSIRPPAIDIECVDSARTLHLFPVQSYSLNDRLDISPSVSRFLLSCNSHNLRI